MTTEKTSERVIQQKSLLPKWAKSGIWGILWISGACWLWCALCGNPLHELALIQRGETTLGFLIDTWEDVEEHDSGKFMWFHGGTYTYSLPDGRKFTQEAEQGSGRLKPELRNLTCPYPVEVEYLPDKPTISRIKGSGHNSVLRWLILKIGLGSLFLILFSIPGIVLLRSAVHSFWASISEERNALARLKTN
jgi:hypothetical protein